MIERDDLTAAGMRETVAAVPDDWTDDEIGTALDAAVPSVTRRSAVVAYHAAAHLVAVSRGADAGQTLSEAAGDMRAMYRDASERTGDAFWTSTRYGRVFVALERRTRRALIVG